ncbi:MAG TPA: nuclear transport factor 2 family protein [Myxococcota bacterium]
MTAAEAADIAEITQAIYRYAWAIDQRDFALLDAIFLSDATLHYNFFGLKPRSFAETKPWLEASLRIHRVTQHNMSTPRVELSGDEASSTTYGILAHAQERLDGTMSVVTQHGVYVDRWQRTPAGWRIASRRLDNLFIVGRFLGPNEVKTFAKPVPY